MKKDMLLRKSTSVMNPFLSTSNSWNKNLRGATEHGHRGVCGGGRGARGARASEQYLTRVLSGRKPVLDAKSLMAILVSAVVSVSEANCSCRAFKSLIDTVALPHTHTPHAQDVEV